MNYRNLIDQLSLIDRSQGLIKFFSKIIPKPGIEDSEELMQFKGKIEHFARKGATFRTIMQRMDSSDTIALIKVVRKLFPFNQVFIEVDCNPGTLYNLSMDFKVFTEPGDDIININLSKPVHANERRTCYR